MNNPEANVCLPCWQAALKRQDTDRFDLLKRLSEKFKHEAGIKTIAIVRTKEKGLLSWRPAFHTGDLEIVEYISFLSGVTVESLHKHPDYGKYIES